MGSLSVPGSRGQCQRCMRPAYWQVARSQLDHRTGKCPVCTSPRLSAQPPTQGLLWLAGRPVSSNCDTAPLARSLPPGITFEGYIGLRRTAWQIDGVKAAALRSGRSPVQFEPSLAACLHVPWTVQPGQQPLKGKRFLTGVLLRQPRLVASDSTVGGISCLAACCAWLPSRPTGAASIITRD